MSVVDFVRRLLHRRRRAERRNPVEDRARKNQSFTKRGPGRYHEGGKPSSNRSGGGLSEAKRFAGGYMNRGEREAYILRLAASGEVAAVKLAPAPAKPKRATKMVSKARHPDSYRGARRNTFFGRRPVGNTKSGERKTYRQRA